MNGSPASERVEGTKRCGTVLQVRFTASLSGNDSHLSTRQHEERAQDARPEVWISCASAVRVALTTVEAATPRHHLSTSQPANFHRCRESPVDPTSLILFWFRYRSSPVVSLVSQTGLFVSSPPPPSPSFPASLSLSHHINQAHTHTYICHCPPMMSPSLRLSLFSFLSFFIVGWWAVEASALSVTATQDVCAQNLYASDCLGVQGCHWCCEAPFGYQCFPAASTDAALLAPLHQGIVTSCAAGATLTSATQTCEALCEGTGGGCAQCVQKSWCYFCASSGVCQAPFTRCQDNSITRTCEARELEDTSAKWETLAILSAVVVVIAVVPALVYGAWCLGSRMGQAWGRWRARRRAPPPERQTLLSNPESSAGPRVADPANPAAASTLTPADTSNGAAAAAPVPALSTRPSTILDDDNVCYLCLAARPSVTFLPCYHTCCCEACSNRLRPVHGSITCPFCRSAVEAMVSLTHLLEHTAVRHNSAAAATAPPPAADSAQPVA